MPNNKSIDNHFYYLKEIGFSDEDILHMKEDRCFIPHFAMSLVMKQAWSRIADSALGSGWLKNTSDRLGGKKIDADSSIIELSANGDENWKLLANSVEKIKTSNVCEKDLLRLIRASQICLLGYMLEIIDGRTGIEAGLYESKVVENNFVPGRAFYELYEELFKYDPENITVSPKRKSEVYHK